MNVYELMSEVEGNYITLDDYGILEVSGTDRERFLSGQTTNDNLALKKASFFLNSRLDRSGKLQTFFYHLKSENKDFLIVPKSTLPSLKEDLEKYIIMDEVEILESNRKVTLLFTCHHNPREYHCIEGKAFHGYFGFLPSLIILDENKIKNIQNLEAQRFQTICSSRAVPILDLTANINQLVTDTVVNLSGVSLSKGCFLGQETVAKIESRRGGAYLPVALELENKCKANFGDKVIIDEKIAGKVLDKFKLDGQSFVLVSLLRNYRIDQKSFSLKIGEENLIGKVNYLPVGGDFDKEGYIDFLYEKAVGIFQNIGNIEAIESFKKVLKVDPAHEDSLESMGVIFGRMEKFEEGISLMEQVLVTNPDSVMAHTNKSLFFMRLGKIEEAEEEKAQATVKSFASFGKVANDKKAAEKRAQEEELEITRRLEMFKQVLEIDPEDELANYGMADVFHSRGKCSEAIPLLEKVINVNSKYSVAYLLLGKCYIQESMKEDARKTLENGISVASSLGDLMPANEMQSLLSGL